MGSANQNSRTSHHKQHAAGPTAQRVMPKQEAGMAQATSNKVVRLAELAEEVLRKP